jgi:tetratricopeptide (TPR) repeat protein
VIGRARRALLLAAAAGGAAACGGTPAAGPAAPLDPVPARVADLVAAARAREEAGDRAGAAADWEAILALRPRHGSALYASARLRAVAGDRAGALERLALLQEEEPNAGRGLLLAAAILSDPEAGPLRDLARAEAFARAALDRNPEESGPHLRLGIVLLLAGKAGPAAERLEVAAAMNPRDAESRSLRGVLALRAGDREGARR